MTSSGEKVLMTQGDNSNFVGFVSDAPVAWLLVSLDTPEPTPPAVVDNLGVSVNVRGVESNKATLRVN